MSDSSVTSAFRSLIIKSCGAVTGSISAISTLVIPYFSSLYLAPLLVAISPISVNYVTAFMLKALSFLPASYAAVIAPNLTPVIVAAITIAVPLFVASAFLVPMCYKLGSIPGESVAVAAEEVIKGLVKGVVAFFAHTFTRLSEILTGETQLEITDKTALPPTDHDETVGYNNIIPKNKGGCNWLFDVFRQDTPKYHNLPSNMSLLGIKITEAKVVPVLEAPVVVSDPTNSNDKRNTI